MLASVKVVSVVAASVFLSVGCGSPASTGDTLPRPTSVASDASSDATHDSAQLPITVPSSDSTTKGEVAKHEASKSAPESGPKSAPSLPQKNEDKPRGKAQVQAAPSTAKDALAAINLMDLPRLEKDNVLQSGPTYVYYSCDGLLPQADAFYKKMFESRGWKEIPPLSPPTDQYVDRFFEKNGYYVRANLSLGSEQGKLGIMLSNAGNVDVRTLPRLSDADLVDGSQTPANITFKTAKSIPDTADAVLKQFTENGWQPCEDFHPTPIDVPHFRDIHFRKEACRLNVGVLKNPQIPAEKTTVFYHAEYVIPFDIPMLDATRPVKLDLSSNRAAFEITNSRKELVRLLQANSQKFGWKLKQAEEFESGEFHMLPIDVDSGAYIVARLFESEGKYSASIESYASAPNSVKPTNDMVASDQEKSVADNSPSKKDTTFDELDDQINSKIQAEVAKALGSLGSPSAKAPMNLAELQAKANEQLAKLGEIEVSLGNDTESKVKSENPFDVDEDTTLPSAEIQAIKKSIGKLKYGNDSYDLPFAACYMMNVNGEPTKCILFSESPIDIEKLKRMLLKEGQPVYGTNLSENSKAIIDLWVSKNSVSLNVKVGSHSIGLSSSKIQADVHYRKGKIVGKVSTIEPIEMRSPLEFSVSLNQTAIPMK